MVGQLSALYGPHKTRDANVMGYVSSYHRNSKKSHTRVVK